MQKGEMGRGDKVRVSGTDRTGTITKCNARRIPNRNSLISFYTVKFEDGTEQEFGREELRFWEDDSYKNIKPKYD